MVVGALLEPWLRWPCHINRYGYDVAKSEAKPGIHEAGLDVDVNGMFVGIVKSSWHHEIVGQLAAGAHRCIEELGAANIIEIDVPGCFELPLGCHAIASQAHVSAVVALGVVVRGETIHFDLVSQGATTGIQQVQLETKVPIGLGILAVENEEQAIARSQDDNEHNAGYDAMYAALAMTALTHDEIFKKIQKDQRGG